MTATPNEFTLTADGVAATVDATNGGRLASLTVGGHQLLVTAAPGDRPTDVFGWGSYPMVPWAGRVAHGRFSHGDLDYQLPVNLGDHSLHGTGFTSPWRRVGSDALALELSDPWPFAGSVSQTFELTGGFFRCRMVVTAQQTMPVLCGWHPWFVRTLANGAEASLDFGQARMYERDQSGIPTGRLVDVPAGPWDDCFTELTATPTIAWGDTLTVELESSCSHWVIYTEPDHALCVEPQSGPPNEFNSDRVKSIQPGQSFESWYSISWRTPQGQDQVQQPE